MPHSRAWLRIITRLCLFLSFATASRAQIVGYLDYKLLASPGNGIYGGGFLTTGSDGAIWVSNGDGLFRITTAGIITPYKNAPRGYAITAGPDGALWTVTTDSKIARITTAGVVTTYPVSTSAGDVRGITAGLDGALWFTELKGNRIGRITTTGRVTEYPLPKPNSYPSSITPGPDGALWFTEWQGIGRITAAGAITEYGGGADMNVDITAGPDGALWFTEDRGKIGRITTTGVLTEYTPPSFGRLRGITAGPDGAIWFTSEVQIIGRITTDGTISGTYIGDHPYLYNITTGPDGALWFTTEATVSRAFLDLTSGSISQLVSGGNWKTTITITNTGADFAAVTLNLFSDTGDPMTLPFTSPQIPGSLAISTITFPMPPYGMYVVETELPPDQGLQSGWAQVIASKAVNASAIFRYNADAGPQEAVVALETRNGSYVLPFDNADFSTSVAVANLAPVPASIPVTVRDELGILLGTDTVQLPPHGHTSFMLADANHSAVMAQLTANRRGTVEFDRPPEGQISVIGIRACPTGAFTSIPVAMK
jgi:virginiamycin B lyase